MSIVSSYKRKKKFSFISAKHQKMIKNMQISAGYMQYKYTTANS